MDETSGAMNTQNNEVQFHDFSSRVATSVNKLTGEVISKEAEDEASIEDELVAAVIANVPPSDGVQADPQETEGELCTLYLNE